MAIGITINDILALTEVLNDKLDMSYAQTLSSTDNWVSKFTDMDTPVEGTTAKFPFLLQAGGLRMNELGEKPLYETILAGETEISLKKFDKGLPLDAMKYSNIMARNLFMKRVEGLAIEVGFLPLSRLCRALNYGDTDAYYTVWDGQQFFSTNHNINGFAYSNLLAGAFSSTTLQNAIQNMNRIPWGDDGEYLPMEGANFTIIAPPAIELDIKNVLTPDWILQAGSGTDVNPLKNRTDAIFTNRLIDDNDWYLLATLPGFMPFIHLVNNTTGLPVRTLVSKNTNESENFERDFYEWYIKTWEEVFPSNWYLATKIIAAGGTV